MCVPSRCTSDKLSTLAHSRSLREGRTSTFPPYQASYINEELVAVTSAFSFSQRQKPLGPMSLWNQKANRVFLLLQSRDPRTRQRNAPRSMLMNECATAGKKIKPLSEYNDDKKKAKLF